MRVLIFGDLQATEGHERLHSDHSVPLQRWRVQEFYRKASILCHERGIEAVWDLGDTLDDRVAVPVPTIDAVVTGYSLLPGDPSVNIKLVGNHEQWSRNGNVNVGKMFNSKFRVVHDLASLDVAGLRIVCAAFIEDTARVIGHLNHELDDSRGDDVVLLGHFPVVGAQMSSGTLLEGVPNEIVKKFTRAFIGHIHRWQHVGPGQWFVGSPFEQDFGEAGDAKKVAVFDTNSLEVEWVELDGFPRYHVCGMGEFKRLAVPESEDRYRVLLSNTDEVDEFYRHDLSTRAEPEYRCSQEGQSSGDAASVERDGGWSLESAMSQYVKENPPGGRGVDLSEKDLINFGVEIASGA